MDFIDFFDFADFDETRPDLGEERVDPLPAERPVILFGSGTGMKLGTMVEMPVMLSLSGL